MHERFDRLEVLITGLGGRMDRQEQKTDSLAAQMAVANKRPENVETICRATATRVDAVSLQVAGVSKRVDRLSARVDQHDKHQRRFAADVTKRMKKAETKAQITIEGHEAIRVEMRREFAKLRGELFNRVQPLELAVRKRR